MAHLANWGICLARTDPQAPKHDGITCFIVDMTKPGIDIRPLKELTGAEFFNEVFFDAAFVPDDCVVGEVNHGWEAGRTTLANERVSMGSGSSFGPGVESILDLAARRRRHELDGQLARVLIDAHAISVMALRSTLRALAGAKPGPEASVRKLIGVEHEQRVQEVGLALLGAEAAIDEGDAKAWIGGFLGNRALSIAGGTSDVQRNIIAERLLGLPKDP
jgi:alkylation response protein AidB-like acyl-CoA dehydrogenase